MADTAKTVERVADRFVKQLTNAFEVALSRGAVRINLNQLEAALAGGSRTAATNQALRALDVDDLRVLAKRQPLEDHLLDVAQASADATRCAVRPTGTGRPPTSVPPAPSSPALPPRAAPPVVPTRPDVVTEQVRAVDDLARALPAPRPMPPRQELLDSTTDYVGGSAPINDALRYGNQIPAGYREAADNLAAAIANSPMAEARTLYRIVPNEVADEWKAGTTMLDPAFVSTTKSSNFLREMASELEDFGGTAADFTTVIIRTQRGTGGLDVNQILGPRHMFARQQEIILAPGTKFEISEEAGQKILTVVKP